MNLVLKDKIFIIILFFIIAVRIECKDSYIPITFNSEFSYSKSTKLPEKGMNLNAFFGILPNVNPNAGIIHDFNFLKLGTTISFDARIKELYNFSLAEIDLCTFLKNIDTNDEPSRKEKRQDDGEISEFDLLIFLLTGNYARFLVKLMDYKEGALFDYKMDWFKLGIGVGRCAGTESTISYNILFILDYTTFKPGTTYYYLWDKELMRNINESIIDKNVVKQLEFGLALSFQTTITKYFSAFLNIEYNFLPSFHETAIHNLSIDADISFTIYKRNELNLSVPAATLFYRFSANESDYNGFSNVISYQLGISLPIPNTSLSVKFPIPGNY